MKDHRLQRAAPLGSAWPNWRSRGRLLPVVAAAMALAFGDGPAAPPPNPSGPDSAAAPAEMLAVPAPAATVVVAPFSEPSPAELLIALNKVNVPRWRQFYGETAKPAPSSRSQTALALGVLMTDLHLAGLARDPQQIRNLLNDLAALEKVVAVNDRLRGRFARLQTLAEAESWEAVRREIDATHDEQSTLLEEMRDEDLARLVPLGAWIRALDIEAAVRATDESSPPPVPAAGHRAFLIWMQERIAALSASARDERIVVLCSHAIEMLLKWEAEAPAVDRRVRIAEALSAIVARIRTP